MNPADYREMFDDSITGVKVNDNDYTIMNHCLQKFGVNKESKKTVEKRFDKLRKGFLNPSHPSSRMENARIRLRAKLAQKKLTQDINITQNN